MPNTLIPPRSPRRLDRHSAALLIVDIQEKLLPTIVARRTLVWNTSRLVRAAGLFNVSVDVTEQYPQRLGGTESDVLSSTEPPRHEKKAFSAAACEGLVAKWSDAGTRQIVIAGIESHVCVLQSCLDLLSEGYEVFVVVDAIGSRHPLDHDTAVRRMRDEGATVLTTESVLFEWCETAAHDQFKALSALVKETGPEPA
ncbi:MAG: hydrolase [Pirellulaceae bacterium]